MPRSRIAAAEFALRWRSPVAHHTERVYFEKLNLWRDFLPGTLADKLGPLAAGGTANESFAAGDSWPVGAPATFTGCARTGSN